MVWEEGCLKLPLRVRNRTQIKKREPRCWKEVSDLKKREEGTWRVKARSKDECLPMHKESLKRSDCFCLALNAGPTGERAEEAELGSSGNKTLGAIITKALVLIWFSSQQEFKQN